MQTHYILTVTSNDKPGVVEAISSAVDQCGGNWLESRLAHLSGKFVGVVRIAISKDQTEGLTQALKGLKNKEIHIECEEIVNAAAAEATAITAKFSAIGPDRNGIVKEISSAFARHSINVEELETDLSSMPYSGDPIFEAKGIVSIPKELDLKALYDKMDAIANDLGVDIDVEANA